MSSSDYCQVSKIAGKELSLLLLTIKYRSGLPRESFAWETLTPAIVGISSPGIVCPPQNNTIRQCKYTYDWRRNPIASQESLRKLAILSRGQQSWCLIKISAKGARFPVIDVEAGSQGDRRLIAIRKQRLLRTAFLRLSQIRSLEILAIYGIRRLSFPAIDTDHQACLELRYVQPKLSKINAKGPYRIERLSSQLDSR